MVNVEQNHGEGVAITRGNLEFVLGEFEPVAAIVHAGERVGAGEVLFARKRLPKFAVRFFDQCFGAA